MPRLVPVVVGALLLLAAACGGDDDPALPVGTAPPGAGGTATTDAPTPPAGELTVDQCFDHLRDVVEVYVIPEGIDASDGLSEEEGVLVEQAYEVAIAATGFDRATDDACMEAIDGAPEDAADAFFAELQAAHPEVIEVLGTPIDQPDDEPFVTVDEL